MIVHPSSSSEGFLAKIGLSIEVFILIFFFLNHLFLSLKSLATKWLILPDWGKL